MGIAQWYAIIGGSLGGMQALQWSVDYPERLQKCVIIASAPKLLQHKKLPSTKWRVSRFCQIRTSITVVIWIE